MILREKVWDWEVTYDFAPTAFGAGGKGHKLLWPVTAQVFRGFGKRRMLNSSEKQTISCPMLCSTDCHVNGEGRVPSQGTSPIRNLQAKTLSWLLQAELRGRVTCLGNTYSHQFPLNIEGKSADCSSSNTHKKAWLCTTELQSRSATHLDRRPE